MADYTFSGQAVVANDDILENATGGTFVDAAGATIPIYDLNDNPISTITSNAFGLSSNFKADVPMGYIKFGAALNRVFADEIAQFAVNAQGAIDTANAASAIASSIPVGGTTDQVLAKASGSDRDMKWVNQTGGGSGVSDHGLLSGLGDDDHPQYLNVARSDARYNTQAQVAAAIAAASSTNSTGDRARANHTGEQTQSTVTGLVAALTGRAQFVLVTTGVEARPTGSSLVVWVSPTGITPDYAVVNDLVFTPSAGTSDSSAPTTPTGLASSLITSSGFTVSWSASSDNVGVTGYDVQVDGTTVATPSGTSAAISLLSPSTAYVVRVRARDAAGNTSGWSSTITVTTSAGSGSTQHSVWGSASPGGSALLKTDGSPSIEAGNCFYRFGTAMPSMRIRGGRVFIPAGTTVPTGTVTIRCYTNTAGVSGSSFGTLAATKAVTATGWSAGWHDVLFDSPVAMPANFGIVCVTATWDGNDDAYLYATGVRPDAATRLDSLDGTPLAWCEAASSSYVPGVAKIGSSTWVAAGAASYCTDLLVDEG